jgi:hypothetical protein
MLFANKEVAAGERPDPESAEVRSTICFKHRFLNLNSLALSRPLRSPLPPFPT